MKKMSTNLSLEKKALPKKRGNRGTQPGDKRGVSPVIGVILMVAATIVIAGVVMAMLGGFKAPTPAKTVGVSTSRINSSYVDITITSIPSGVTIESAGVSVAGSYDDWSGSIIVGSTKTVAATTGQHVVVNATFNDGTGQVILDTIV
jgi:flagellin-like protein